MSVNISPSNLTDGRDTNPSFVRSPILKIRSRKSAQSYTLKLPLLHSSLIFISKLFTSSSILIRNSFHLIIKQPKLNIYNSIISEHFFVVYRRTQIEQSNIKTAFYL